MILIFKNPGKGEMLMESLKLQEISSSVWERENSKAEKAIRSFFGKLPSETVQEEFYHLCKSRFYELLTKNCDYPNSYYKECFRKIFVDMCRKNSLYLHTYSKPTTSPVFEKEPAGYVDPTPGVTKTQILKEAISQLTPDEQRLIYMMDFCNMSSKRVSSLLGMDQSTHSRRRKKILKKMKEWIIKKWGDEIWSI
jgi:RNA polymerase sigma factor (sigma-70 family)